MMPWPKRLLLAAAVSAGLALLALSAWLIHAGVHVLGGGLLAFTLAASAFALDVFWVRWDWSGGSLRSGRRGSSQVALTFDDGPGPDTPAILDALDAAGARATFFVLGAAAAKRPDLVREVARRGHLVAQHGLTHRKLHLAGPATVARELDGGRAAIAAAGVEPAPFFRAPHGFKGPVLGLALRKRGLRLVGWTRGVWDTERPGAEAIAERATAGVRGGEILLLHDGCGTPGIDPRRDQTAAAVPEIVRRCREAGLELVTVDRLVPAPPLVSWGRVVRIAGLALIAAFAVLAVKRLDLREVTSALGQARLWPLALAIAANLVALAAQSLRWLALARPVVPRARPWDTYVSMIAGFAVGMVMPARAADVARMHLLARRTDGSMATVGGTVVLDHVLSGVSLIAFLAVFGAVAPLPAWATRAVWTSLGLAVVTGGMAWWLRPRVGTRPDAEGFRGVIQRARRGFLAVSEPRAMALSIVAGLAGWAMEVAIGLFVFDAFGMPATVKGGVLVMLATTVSAALAVSPGNAGAFEVAVVLALGGLGVAPEPALAFAIAYHAVHLVPVALLGGGFILQAGYRSGLVREVP